MNENLDKEMKRLEKETVDDLRPAHKDEYMRRGKAPRVRQSQRKVLILGGVGALLLIVLFAIFFVYGNEFSTEESSTIQARVKQLEARLSSLEGMEDRIVFLDKQEKELLDYVSETDKSGRYLADRLDVLSEEIDRLEKRIGSAPAKTETSLTSQRKPFPLTKGHYHEVRLGDSLYRIAQRYGTSVEELCRLNNIIPDQVIYPGQRLLVAPEE
jgi:uncharacterized coiled-coil protein SlyX